MENSWTNGVSIEMKEGARQVSINSRGRSCQVHGGCRPGSCCRMRERERERESERERWFSLVSLTGVFTGFCLLGCINALQRCFVFINEGFMVVSVRRKWISPWLELERTKAFKTYKIDTANDSELGLNHVLFWIILKFNIIKRVKLD
jgi:hypothetical protein